MTIAFERVAVIGATGPTGRALVREFVRRGIKVRAISRAMARLAAAFPYDPIEKRGADARDVVGLSTALAGCDLVIDCIGLPAGEMDQHVVSARTIAAILRASGARAIQVSSTWSYMPIGALPLNEAHPRDGGPPWAGMRRKAEDVLRGAGAAIVHLPDFFGPGVHAGTLQMALADVVAQKPMNWVGGADVTRDYIFVPDAMRIVADLSAQDGAYGDDWIMPGSGPVSARRIAEILSDILDRRIRPRCAGMGVLRALALFDRKLAAFLQVAPEYAKPVSYDGSKLERLIGPQPRTSYEAAIAKTVDWLSGT